MTFHFLLHLITLASFFKIAVSYTYAVRNNCGTRQADVNDWVTEAIFLFDRAAKVLESSIGSNAIPMTYDVKNILQTCLGKTANETDFSTVRG